MELKKTDRQTDGRTDITHNAAHCDWRIISLPQTAWARSRKHFVWRVNADKAGADIGFHYGECPIHLKGAPEVERGEWSLGEGVVPLPRKLLYFVYQNNEFVRIPGDIYWHCSFQKGHPNHLDTPWIRRCKDVSYCLLLREYEWTLHTNAMYFIVISGCERPLGHWPYLWIVVIVPFLSEKCLPKRKKSGVGNPLFWENLGAERKFWAAIISSVENLQLSAPPHTLFLTHDTADYCRQ